MTSILTPAENELLVGVFGRTESFTVSQLRSLNYLLKDGCPIEMKADLEKMKENGLENVLRMYQLGTGRGSTASWRTLLSAVSVVLPGIYKLPRGKADLLLNGLCNSPRSQVVSIPLFVALVMAWRSGAGTSNATVGGADGESTGSEKQIEEAELKAKIERYSAIQSAMAMTISDLTYIFDLVRERLTVELTRTASLSNTMSMEDLVMLLRKSRAVVDNTKLERFVCALQDSAVGAPGVEVLSFGSRFDIVDEMGNVNASNLLEYCSFAEQGHIFQLPGYRTKREKALQTRVSTNLLRSVKRAWPVAHARLQQARCDPVTAAQFGAMIREGGTMLSSDDVDRIWDAMTVGVAKAGLLGSGSEDSASEELALAHVDTFIQAFVEVDNDPKSFVMMTLMDKGEVGRDLRRAVVSPRGNQVYEHSIDLTWEGESSGSGDLGSSPGGSGKHATDDTEKLLGGISPRKKHFEQHAVGDRKGALPWEEVYRESGHDQSALEAKLREHNERAQRHHYARDTAEGHQDHNPLPWMDNGNNEGAASTNLQRRITLRVHSMSPDKFQVFVSSLKKHSHMQSTNAERNRIMGQALPQADFVDYSDITGDELLSRVTLREALADSGVHVGAQDSAEIFQVLARYCVGKQRIKAGSGQEHPVTLAALVQWMGSTSEVGTAGREIVARYSELVGRPLPGWEDSMAGRSSSSNSATPSRGQQQQQLEQEQVQPGSMRGLLQDPNGDGANAPADFAEEYGVQRAHYPQPNNLAGIVTGGGSSSSSSSSSNNSSCMDGGSSSSINNSAPPPPPADFIFGQRTGSPTRPPAPHLRTNSIFNSPAGESGGSNKTAQRHRQYNAPPAKDIFAAVSGEDAGFESRNMPSWKQAAADRARGCNSANRIFGVDDGDDSSVLAPPPPPRPMDSAASFAARQTAGSLSGASGHPVGTEDIIAVLQAKRANVALVFRRLAAQSDLSAGLISLPAFSQALPDLVGGGIGASLRTQPDVCWQAACDIAGVPYSPDTDHSIHFNDVLRFLDKAQRDADSGQNGAQIMRSLKDKFFRSRDLAGQKMKLITMTPQLRQRQRQRVLNNRSKSKGVSGPASAYEFVDSYDVVDLFATVDVHLNNSEARWLCDQSASAEDRVGMLEPATRLSSVVQYISNNLLV